MCVKPDGVVTGWSIHLRKPFVEALRNRLKRMCDENGLLGVPVGADIGGTLAKAAWIGGSQHWAAKWGVDPVYFPELSFHLKKDGPVVHLCSFASHQVPKWLETKERMSLRAVTGGGAHKFESHLKSRNSDISLHDEMSCLLKGLGVLVEQVPDECYHLQTPKQPEKSTVASVSLSYPFLLVNIGTGVSILRVHSATSFERVGGSAVGGGTYAGLCALLLPGIHSFESAMKMSAEGDANKVNMLVRDIYGGGGCGLPADLLASCFGKVLPDKTARQAIATTAGGAASAVDGDKSTTVAAAGAKSATTAGGAASVVDGDKNTTVAAAAAKSTDAAGGAGAASAGDGYGASINDGKTATVAAAAAKSADAAGGVGAASVGDEGGGGLGYEARDVAASLLHMVASNVAQIAYLTSRTQPAPLKQIVFAGNFLRQNRQSIGYIAHAVDFWSQSKQHALFLKHEGFCGAIGALALAQSTNH